MLRDRLDAPTSHGWLIALPTSFCTRRPALGYGQIIPLSDYFQVDREIVWFGRITGMTWRADLEEWVYMVEPPPFHQYSDDLDCQRESEALARIHKM